MNAREQFFSLTPDRVLEAVEAGGTPVTGLCYPLNSLENRVYELERDDRSRVVAKFYRPGRWSAETILEEHAFLRELEEAEIPVCAPLAFPDGTTLKQVAGTPIHYALFPRVGGRAPEELDDAQLRRLGALLARIHTVGAARTTPHRLPLTPTTYGEESTHILEESGLIPLEERRRFAAVVSALLRGIAPGFEGLRVHRIHGDCHLGNLLWGSQGPFFLDFDDMVIGPPAQDIWLLVPGRDAYALRQREVLLEGYATFQEFPRATLSLIEPLRSLRYLRYAAWICRRWDDPSFPAAFPHFGTPRYWTELLQDLEEQLELIGASAPAGDAPRTPAPQEFEIREVAPGGDEFQRVLALREEVFVEELGRDLDEELDGQERGARHFLVLSPEGRAIACARARPGLDRVLTIERLAVLPAWRKKGVGGRLLRQLEHEARAAGARGLEVLSPVSVLPFFGRFDFLATGRPFAQGPFTLRRMLREWADIAGSSE